VLLVQPSRFKYIQIKPLCCKGHQITFQNYSIRHWFKKPNSLAHVSSHNSNHSNVFTFPLTLSEVRAHEAWELSNKIMVFLPHKIKCRSHLPWFYSLLTYSSTILSCLSLSGFKGLNCTTHFRVPKETFPFQSQYYRATSWSLSNSWLN
jgi:hypothetical protein